MSSSCLVSLRLASPVQLVQRLELGVPLEQQVLLDPPRQPGPQLVGNVATGRHAKDKVELFEGAFPVIWSAFMPGIERQEIEGGGRTNMVSGTIKKMTMKARMLRPA